MHCCNPAPERTLRSFGLVDDCDQLKVAVAERHDAVRRAPARVTTALGRYQAVPRFDLPRGCGQVSHRDQYVVELHPSERIIQGHLTHHRRQASFPHTRAGECEVLRVRTAAGLRGTG